MKRLRILILLFSVAVFAVFGVTRVQEAMTSDYVAPVSQAEYDAIRASVAVTDEDLLTGITATDNLDGDVTDSLYVVSKSNFILRGTRRIGYAAFDRNNNVGTYSRMLTYTDYVSPHFSISQPLHFLDGNSNLDYLKYVKAYDCLDGNITGQVRVTFGDTVGVSSTVSSRKLNLQVTNSAGDTASLELEAQLKDYNTYYLQSPALSDYLIYTAVGTKPTYSDLLAGVISGDRTKAFNDTAFDPYADVSINDSGVDYYTPGTYSVSFQLSRLLKDGSRELLGTTILYVVVEG